MVIHRPSRASCERAVSQDEVPAYAASVAIREVSRRLVAWRLRAPVHCRPRVRGNKDRGEGMYRRARLSPPRARQQADFPDTARALIRYF